MRTWSQPASRIAAHRSASLANCRGSSACTRPSYSTATPLLEGEIDLGDELAARREDVRIDLRFGETPPDEQQPETGLSRRPDTGARQREGPTQDATADIAHESHFGLQLFDGCQRVPTRQQRVGAGDEIVETPEATALPPRPHGVLDRHPEWTDFDGGFTGLQPMPDDTARSRFPCRPMCRHMDRRHMGPLRCAEAPQGENGLVTEELPRSQTRCVGPASVGDGVDVTHRPRSHTVEGCCQV
jgi:hypothetical protein